MKTSRLLTVLLLATVSSFSAALTKTTTTITSSLSPSVYEESVTFTAVVTPAPPNNETVTFKQGVNILGTGALNGGSATFTISTLSAGGIDNISAAYGGDSIYASSTATAVKQVVDAAPTTTSLASSENPSNIGQSVTLTATVTPSEFGGTATGNVAFYSGSKLLGQTALSGGVASLATTTLAAGTDSITAVYKGSTSFTTSTSGEVNQVVSAQSTTTNLSSSLNPANVGQTVTFTANVVAQGSGKPTGTVSFYNGSSKLGNVTLNGEGVATYALTKQVAVTWPITAVYNGSSSLSSSTSGVLSQTWGTGTTINATMSWNNVTRYYEVFVPTALPANPPLVLMLHGTRFTSTFDPQAIISVSWGWQSVADTYGFILVQPASTWDSATTQWNWNAYCMDGTALCAPYGSNGGAFAYAEGCGSQDGECPDDIGFLGALIQNLTTQYSVNPNQVYVTGFSSGAQMTERVGVELSNLVAAIAPVAGPIYNAEGVVTPPLPFPPVPASYQPISVQLWEGTEDQNLWPCGYGQTNYSGVIFTVDSADDTFNFWSGRVPGYNTNACTTFQTTTTLCANGEPNNANDAPTPGVSGDSGNIATGCANNVEVQVIWEPGVAHSDQSQTNVNRWLFFANNARQSSESDRSRR
jgi:poly(3-hydroxybutyrate) depolymerase